MRARSKPPCGITWTLRTPTAAADPRLHAGCMAAPAMHTGLAILPHSSLLTLADEKRKGCREHPSTRVAVPPSTAPLGVGSPVKNHTGVLCSEKLYKSESPVRRRPGSGSKSRPASECSPTNTGLSRHSHGPLPGLHPSALSTAAASDSREAAEANAESAEAARRAKQAQRIVQEKGCHPYRIVLSDVVQRLRNTKARMEALISGQKLDDSLPWCDPPPPPHPRLDRVPNQGPKACTASGRGLRATPTCAQSLLRAWMPMWRPRMRAGTM